VIFDSCATPQPSETGTKVTVMLGGHHWNGRTSFPSDAEGVRMARDVLRRHLNIDQEPLAANVALNRDCIPQYNVGHDERLQTVKKALLDTFDGRLSVAGASYTGVGMNDCIRSARDVAKGLVEHGGRHTGLEHMGEELRWVGNEK
jgi:oxygen-dependent protoporphyrinogen oxidase